VDDEQPDIERPLPSGCPVSDIPGKTLRKIPAEISDRWGSIQGWPMEPNDWSLVEDVTNIYSYIRFAKVPRRT
jgi:hypothetical protein